MRRAVGGMLRGLADLEREHVRGPLLHHDHVTPSQYRTTDGR